MALPSSGAISMSQVNAELGLSSSATISLNDTRVRLLANVPSGAISMNNLRGKQVPTIVNTASPAESFISSNTYPFGTQSLGSEASSRVIVALVTGDSGSGNRFVTGVTLDGAGMTQVLSVSTSNSGSAAAAIFYVAKPTGTSADVVVSTTTNLGPVCITLFAVYGLNSSTPYSSASDTSPGTTLNPNTAAIATNYDSVIFGVADCRSAGASWSGITERRVSSKGSFAWDSSVGFSASRSITQYFAGSTSSMVIASWR